jgi:hypothetical protein
MKKVWVRTVHGPEADMMQFFKSRGKPFEVIRTAYTSQFLGGPFAYIVSRERLYLKHLGLIRSLRLMVTKQVEGKTIHAAHPEKLFAYNQRTVTGMKGTFPDILEVDLSAAYISAAYQLNYINRDMFNKLLATKKIYRLKILGSLATKKITTRYDEAGKIVETLESRDPMLTACWRNIVSHVNGDMQEQCKRSDKWLFYWVDNFFSSPALSTAFNTFRDRGYGLKISRTSAVYQRNLSHYVFALADGRYFTMGVQ